MKKQYSTTKRKRSFSTQTAIAILFFVSAAFNYSFGQCISADDPVISPSNGVGLCEGDTVTFTWTGNLNDDTTWIFYNNELGTTDYLTGNSFQTIVSQLMDIEVYSQGTCSPYGYGYVYFDANPSYEYNFLKRICTGDSLLINGTYESTSGAYADLLQTINGCDSTINIDLIVGEAIDQVITPAQTLFCDSGTVMIDLQSSDPDFDYYLRVEGTNAIVDGPISGTGSSISFDPGMVNTSTSYNVFGERNTSYAAIFDTTSNYLDGGPPATLNDNNVTMECWVKWDGNTDGAKTIMVNGHEGNGGYSMRLNTDSTLYVLFGGIGYLFTNTQLIPDTWTHLAVTGNTSNLWTYYINGNYINSTGINNNPPASWHAFNVGIDAAGNGPFDGNIDNVRVWDIARTQAEIQQDMNNCLIGTEPNLVALITFENEGMDLTGNGHDLIPTNYTNSPWGSGMPQCNASCGDQMSTIVTIGIGNAEIVSMTSDLCAGDTLTLGTQTITTGGTFTEVLQSYYGCDSTVNLTVNLITVDNGISVSGITLTADASGATYQWVDCNNGNAQINGETSQSFTPTINGSYAVEVTENGCTETSACETINEVGIFENYINMQILVYPNPNEGKFYLEINGSNNELYSVEMFNNLGQIVYSDQITMNNSKLIELADKAPGMYTIRVGNENTETRQKIIIQ